MKLSWNFAFGDSAPAIKYIGSWAEICCAKTVPGRKACRFRVVRHLEDAGEHGFFWPATKWRLAVGATSERKSPSSQARNAMMTLRPP